MHEADHQITFSKMIRLDRIERDVTKLLVRLREFGIGGDVYRLVPTFIHLSAHRPIKSDSVPLMRYFLKALRPFQLSHFLRFSSHLDNVMEADCGDIFYHREDNSFFHRDATWVMRFVGSNHVELKIKVHPKSLNHNSIWKLSSKAKAVIPHIDPILDEDDIHQCMMKFHYEHSFEELLENQKDDIHVLFVPSVSNDVCHVIPLYGLTHQDAIRRTHYTDKTFSYFHHTRSDMVDDEMFGQIIISHLVTEIQDNESGGERHLRAAQTYGLAELLFGYYLRSQIAQHDKDHHQHEFVWFESTKDNGMNIVDTHSFYLK